MQLAALGHAFDGTDLTTFGFDGQHQAGTNEAIVQRDAAGTAIARRTAFLRTGQAQGAAQCVEHGVVRLAKKLHRLAVDGSGNMQLGHDINSLRHAWRRWRRHVSVTRRPLWYGKQYYLACRRSDGRLQSRPRPRL